MWLAAAIWAIAVLGAEAERKPLFDGAGFSGWEGNLAWFRIEDGAIVGGTLEKDIPRNEFLCTTERYGDFELTLSFRLLGDGANAGVQFRTARIPDHHEVVGYQADIGDGYWGCLYDESRRNRILAGPEKETVEAVLKKGEWNAYRIRCEGDRIRLWLNGALTVDYVETDPSVAREGVIALQIHSGPPSEAWYKNIVIQELTGESRE